MSRKKWVIRTEYYDDYISHQEKTNENENLQHGRSLQSNESFLLNVAAERGKIAFMSGLNALDAISDHPDGYNIPFNNPTRFSSTIESDLSRFSISSSVSWHKRPRERVKRLFSTKLFLWYSIYVTGSMQQVILFENWKILLYRFLLAVWHYFTLNSFKMQLRNSKAPHWKAD